MGMTWNVNGNEITGMGGNGIPKVIPARLCSILTEAAGADSSHGEFLLA